MDGGSDDDRVLSNWIKRCLEAGDNPDIIKAALKNQGHDPALVNVVLKTGIVRKDVVHEKVSETAFYNTELKSEVDGLMAERPVSPENTAPVSPATKNRLPDWHLAEKFKNPGVKFHLPSFSIPDFNLPKIDLKFPKPSIDSIKWILISAIAVVAIFAIFYGLNWYADRAAKAVLG